MRTIAHLSDLHFGRHDPAIVEALLQTLEASSADVVVVSGDFTQRALKSEFAEARRFLDRITAPKLVVPGNHDVPLYNVVSRFLNPFDHFHSFVAPVGSVTGSYADDEVAILGINTARRLTRKNGRVSVEQMAEIRRVFGQAPAEAFKILVSHHPLGIPTGSGAVDLAGRSRPALTAIAEAGVHVLLSGHYHRASIGGIAAEMSPGGSVLVVHAGTAVSTRTRGSDGNSFNLIRVEPNLLSATVMLWTPGRGFGEGRTCTFALRDGIWHPV